MIRRREIERLLGTAEALVPLLAIRQSGLVLLVLLASWHSHLGVRVVIEDYVHAPGAKTVALILAAFAHALLAVVLACAIVILSLGVAR